MRNNTRTLLPFILLFVILNAFFIGGRNFLERQQVDNEVLIIANLVLFLATVLSFSVAWRSFRSPHAGSSVRGMYLSFMIKFFICVIAAFVYIMTARKNINKPGLFIAMGLYLVYTVMEVSALTRLLKQKKNG